MPAMTISDTRRENLRNLIRDHDGVSQLAKKLGYTNASFLVQLAGPNPLRTVTEKTCRKFEQTLKLPAGWFDKPVETTHAASAHAPAKSASQASAKPVPEASLGVTADVIRMVGKVLEEEQLNLPPLRFADLLVLALTDTAEHGGQGRPEHVRQVVKLMK